MDESLLSDDERKLGEVRAEIMKLNGQIVYLQRTREKLKKERRKLGTRLAEPSTGTNNGADSLAVPRTQLALEILAWYAEYEDEMGTMKGAQRILSMRSKVSTKEIRTIVRGPTASDKTPRKFVTYRVADRILTAINRQDALTDGRIHIVANPFGRPYSRCEDDE